MGSPYHRILLVFADGVGLAPASASNPLATSPAPGLRRLLGGPLTDDRLGASDGVALAALDARLEVAGLPQSVTGQASLFTGVNAARLAGRHVTGFVGSTVRELLERGSLFSWAGRGVTFANAYAPLRPDLRSRRRRPESVTTVATRAAGLPRRTADDLLAGEAVSWDIGRRRFARATGLELPEVTPRRAGRHLARLANRHRLTVFETFLTDLAGHGRGVEAAEAVAAVDGLLAGALSARSPELTVLLTSDHGNLEDAATRAHTLNPVPLLAIGPLAVRFAGLSSILEVTPRIVECLQGPGAAFGESGSG